MNDSPREGRLSDSMKTVYDTPRQSTRELGNIMMNCDQSAFALCGRKHLKYLLRAL